MALLLLVLPLLLTLDGVGLDGRLSRGTEQRGRIVPALQHRRRHQRHNFTSGGGGSSSIVSSTIGSPLGPDRKTPPRRPHLSTRPRPRPVNALLPRPPRRFLPLPLSLLLIGGSPLPPADGPRRGGNEHVPRRGTAKVPPGVVEARGVRGQAGVLVPAGGGLGQGHAGADAHVLLRRRRWR